MVQIWPYSRHLKVPLSPEMTSVQVCRSPYCEGFTIDLDNNHREGTESTALNVPAEYRVSNNTLEIFFRPANRVDYKQLATKSIGMWPIVRRLLTEARDRTQPIFSLASAR
jgi:hypothetical protein